MKKFAVKFVIFAFIVGMPLVLLNVAYTQTNFWAVNNSRYHLNSYPENIQLLNLGNSHERAGFRWTKTFNGVAFNFAAESQSPRYSFYFLKIAEMQ